MRSLRKVFIGAPGGSAAPASPRPPRINVHVWCLVLRTAVQAEAADQLGIMPLDRLDRKGDELDVGQGEPPIGISIDRHIRRIAILMAADAGEAVDEIPAGGIEPGVDRHTEAYAAGIAM